jgi:hypothetical protein
MFEAGFPAVKVIGEITMGVVRQPVPPKKLQTMKKERKEECILFIVFTDLTTALIL